MRRAARVIEELFHGNLARFHVQNLLDNILIESYLLPFQTLKSSGQNKRIKIWEVPSGNKET